MKRYIVTEQQLKERDEAVIMFAASAKAPPAELFAAVDALAHARVICEQIEVPGGATHFAQKVYISKGNGELSGKEWHFEEIPK